MPKTLQHKFKLSGLEKIIIYPLCTLSAFVVVVSIPFFPIVFLVKRNFDKDEEVLTDVIISVFWPFAIVNHISNWLLYK